MAQRPNRPEESFLQKIGIFYLPPDVDITITEPRGYIDRRTLNWVSRTAYIVSRVDSKGNVVEETQVPAFESETRTKHHIWRDLKDTLTTMFNAIAIERGSFIDLRPVPRPKRPSEEFLHRVGVAHLPENVDVTVRNNGIDCARAFVIQQIGHGGKLVAETEISARDTRAHTPQMIWQKVGETLVHQFGALPLRGPRLV